MALIVPDAGSVRTISRGKIKVAGVLRDLRTVEVMDGGTLRTVAVFADPLSVSVFAVRGSQPSSTVTTPPVTATPSGGLAPYSYAWTLVSNGGGAASTSLSPSNSSSAFRKTGLAAGALLVDTWRITVTDSSGATAATDTPISFFNSTGDIQ